MKQSIQFLAFGLLAVAVTSFAFSEQVMALVEPHITITMDPGQTTKPFQIKDDLGSEVFSVAPTGGISGGTTELIYEADGPISIPSGTMFPDYIILAQWEITKPAGALDAEILVFSAGNHAEMRRTSGTDFVGISTLISPDGVAYNDQGGIGTNSDTNEAVSDGFAEITSYSPNTRFIAVGATNGDMITSGEIKNVKFYLNIVLPHGWTIARVL